MPNGITKASKQALIEFNKANGTAWTFGGNLTTNRTEFETFVNKFLFPKLAETELVSEILGNRFQRFAVEQDFIGQYSEEYVILDSVPVDMNLSKKEELFLKRNYPLIASKIYGNSWFRKVKFTLNDNDVRQNFITLADATKYAIGVLKKKISDINITEEAEFKAMLIEYALNVAKEKRTASTKEEVIKKLSLAILNMQNNSDKYNETSTASGGALGRYTTVSSIDDLLIITSDEIKADLLNTQIATSYNIQGLDITNKIISFNDLGGVYKLKEDFTLSTNDQITKLSAMGDYQSEKGDVIEAGTIFTFDVTGIFGADKVQEIKPTTENFALVLDKRAIRYKQYTKGMIVNFFNPEFKEWNYWLHYYSFKSISPFYNKIVIGG